MAEYPQAPDLVVDGHLEPEALYVALKDACRKLLLGWEGLGDAEIEVGGMEGLPLLSLPCTPPVACLQSCLPSYPARHGSL